MLEDSILPSVFLPIVAGLFTAGVGAYKETRFVSSLSIIVTLGNVFITLLFTSTSSISFYIWLPFSIAGIIIIAQDVKKNAKNPYVAFFFGSKTIGSVTFFLGLTTNNWVMPTFEPIYMALVRLSLAEPLTGTELQIAVHVLGVLIVLFVVHLIGRIIGVLHKHHRFFF